MCYRFQLTKDILNKTASRPNKKIHIDKYKDIFHSEAYLNAVRDGDIQENDMMVIMPIDGTQLYQSKQSDC
ncbi:hypothetical protein CPC08DRAFT_649866 [Agrocybe pediades]|nr:hypothetical protein CPC08DRAFT_649866 [Agrocybe pediades]